MIDTYKDRLGHHWRWGEQWIIHAGAWFALAICWQSALGDGHD